MTYSSLTSEEARELDKLSETREKDRIKMARIVKEVVKECSPQRGMADIILDPWDNQKAVSVRISTAHDLAVSVDFNGNTPQATPNTFVLSWYFDLGRKSNKILRNEFCPGNVNEFHHRKATDVCYGFSSLIRTLAARLTMAEDGSAFDERD